MNHKRLHQRIRSLQKQEANRLCCDCSARNPAWTSIFETCSTKFQSSDVQKVGVFACYNCAQTHRDLGKGTTTVRSVAEGIWTHEDILAVERGGNKNVNAVFEANLEKESKDKSTLKSDLMERNLFYHRKYVKKEYYAVEAPKPTKTRSSPTTKNNRKGSFQMARLGMDSPEKRNSDSTAPLAPSTGESVSTSPLLSPARSLAGESRSRMRRSRRWASRSLTDDAHQDSTRSLTDDIHRESIRSLTDARQNSIRYLTDNTRLDSTTPKSLPPAPPLGVSDTSQTTPTGNFNQRNLTKQHEVMSQSIDGVSILAELSSEPSLKGSKTRFSMSGIRTAWMADLNMSKEPSLTGFKPRRRKSESKNRSLDERCRQSVTSIGKATRKAKKSLEAPFQSRRKYKPSIRDELDRTDSSSWEEGFDGHKSLPDSFSLYDSEITSAKTSKASNSKSKAGRSNAQSKPPTRRRSDNPRVSPGKGHASTPLLQRSLAIPRSIRDGIFMGKSSSGRRKRSIGLLKEHLGLPLETTDGKDPISSTSSHL